MVTQEDPDLPSGHTKSTPIYRQFLLKRYWGLTEQLLYKIDHTENSRRDWAMVTKGAPTPDAANCRGRIVMRYPEQIRLPATENKSYGLKEQPKYKGNSSWTLLIGRGAAATSSGSEGPVSATVYVPPPPWQHREEWVRALTSLPTRRSL